MARLFECLVVYGAGLTLAGCGARSPLDGGPSTAEDGGGGASTGKAGTGSSAHGGTPDLGFGGSIASGGQSITAGTSAVAGMSAAGSAGTTSVEIPHGSEGRWTCRDEIVTCGTGTFLEFITEGFVLGAACMSDSSRPASAADCAPGERFTCLVGFYEGQSLLFNCECAQPVNDCPCPQKMGGCNRPTPGVLCADWLTACSCAYTCITK